MYSAIALLIGLVLTGCAHHGNLNPENDFGVTKPMVLDASFLEESDSQKSKSGEEKSFSDQIDIKDAGKDGVSSTMQRLTPIAWPKSSLRSTSLLGDLFSDESKLQITADKMPMGDFIHYVFGKLLNVNYILDETLSDSNNDEGLGDVTLSLKNAVSPRELFRLVSELFLDRGVQITYGNQSFFFTRYRRPSRAIRCGYSNWGEPQRCP